MDLKQDPLAGAFRAPSGHVTAPDVQVPEDAQPPEPESAAPPDKEEKAAPDNPSPNPVEVAAAAVPPTAEAESAEVDALLRRVSELERKLAEADAAAVSMDVNTTAAAEAGAPENPEEPAVDDSTKETTPEDAAVQLATEAENPGNPNAILHIPTMNERGGGAEGRAHFIETELSKTRLSVDDWIKFQLPKLIDSGVMQLDELQSWPGYEGVSAIVADAGDDAADAAQEEALAENPESE